MTDHLRHLDDAELARALYEVGRRLAYPDADLASAVTARLQAPRRTAPLWRPPRLLVAVALLVTLTAGTAVAAGLGVPGITLRPPPVDAGRPGPPLVADERFLGQRVGLDEARARVAFDVVLPRLPDLPEPKVHVGDEPVGGRVSLVYPDLVLTQFIGSNDPEFLVKEADAAQPVTVAGAEGVWIEGEHTAAPPLDVGTTGRAASTLLWTRGALTLRLESGLPLSRVLEVAESVR